MKTEPSLSLAAIHQRSVIILTVLACFATLKLASPVLMPLTAAFFLVAITWPIKVVLERKLPRPLSYLGSYAALILVIGLFVGSIWIGSMEIADTLPKYKDEFRRLLFNAKQTLANTGVDTSEDIKLKDVQSGIGLLLTHFHNGLIYLAIIIGYLVLALPEIGAWKTKMRTCLGKDNSDKVYSTAEQLGTSIYNYLVAMLIAGIISAVGTGAVAFACGLDFALSWAILAFLMNFIPTIGAILIIIPPTLLAFIQFDGLLMPMIVLSSMSVIQITVGMYLDPLLQGNRLSISPLVILFSLALWGFLWGIPGALLATPLTHAIIIICHHFERTQWIACLLSSQSRPEKQLKS